MLNLILTVTDVEVACANTELWKWRMGKENTEEPSSIKYAVFNTFALVDIEGRKSASGFAEEKSQ